MSRVINPNSAGKERASLRKGIALAIRSLALSTDIDNESRDIVAFIILGLDAIAATVENTVVAWEKRDYWVKADKFRAEWSWAGTLAALLREALLKDDWDSVPKVASQIAWRLSDVTISPKHRLDRPWQGAYQRLILNSTGR